MIGWAIRRESGDMRSLGMPYIGSKTRYARRIIEALPKADTFVDLFAGGGAITHAAILSNKYKRYIFNDIDTSITDAIVKADGFDFNRFVSNDDFERLKDSDFIIRSCWSYASLGTRYQYNQIQEDLMHGVWDAYVLNKRERLDALIGDDYSIDVSLAYNTHLRDCLMCYYYNKKNGTHLSAGKLEASKKAIQDAFKNSGLKKSDLNRYSIINRKILSDSEYVYPNRDVFDYMNEKIGFNFDYDEYKPDWNDLPGACVFAQNYALERYNRIKSFSSDMHSRDIEFFNQSYDDIDLSGVSFVYCDPPYRDTLNAYNCDFDYSNFVRWLEYIDIPAFISEYTAPSDNFVSVVNFNNRSILGNSGSKKKPSEHIFIRRDFVDWYNDLMRGD